MIEVAIVIAAIFVILLGFVVFFGAPYVPTKRSDLKIAFDQLYKLTPNDVLVDIGSGDGIVLRTAAKRGAKAIGYEINPFLVAVSRWISRSEPRVSVEFANFWRRPLPNNTTVVYTFGESRDIQKMANRIQTEANRIGRTLWFISYGFTIPGLTYSRKQGAHFLYEFSPLQRDKAQV